MDETLSIESVGKNDKGERMVRITIVLPARSVDRTREILRDATKAGATIRYRSLREYLFDAWRRRNQELLEATPA